MVRGIPSLAVPSPPRPDGSVTLTGTWYAPPAAGRSVSTNVVYSHAWLCRELRPDAAGNVP